MKTRSIAIVPILCCIAALILSFLCLFAGHKKDFMEDYHLITLNTSRLGYNVLDTSRDTDNDPSNKIEELWDKAKDKFKDKVNEVAGDMAERLGVDDFYSVHMMDFCYGDYTPTPLPNATISHNDISKNVTACSNQTAMFAWDPKKTIEEKLNKTGTGVTLEDLKWPKELDKGIDALKTVQKATFVLYCVSIALIFIALVASVVAVFTTHRTSACLNILVAIFAFLAIGLASALSTAVIVEGAKRINAYTDDIGIEAHRGGKFLALTWAATGVMLVALVFWCVELCFGSRKHKKSTPVKQIGTRDQSLDSRS